MASSLNLRPAVQAARQRLAAGREALYRRHQNGTPGVQLAAAMTDLFDGIVLDLYEAAMSELDETTARRVRANIALVPHGGYGRRDVAPYSDVDLMLLHTSEISQDVVELARRLFRDINDAGFSVGNSVRTPNEACQMALKDAAVCTSQIESRFLAGSVTLYSKFAEKFQRLARRKLRNLLPAMQEARLEERIKYGETAYLLEPNIKRSRGTLRGIQLLRWIGFARYGANEPQSLRLCGALSRDDYYALRDALEFLLRLRNELHFFAGRANDRLDRSEQLRIAELFGFTGNPGVMPVERFMQEYFRHTGMVSHVVTRFVSGAQPGRWWREALTPLWSHLVEGDFWVGPWTIRATRRGLKKLTGNLEQALRLADLANLYDKQMDYATSEAIRNSVPQMSPVVTTPAAQRFISLLERPARLGEVLRELHDIRVLEILVPPLKHARNLMQFNQYHKFTIDEHTLQAIERATDFRHDPGPFGRVYRQIKKKWLLHLALLIHDLGKGFEEDHSELGRRLALETADILRLSTTDAEKVAFLVHKHLQMSHLAFRRDISDDQLVVKFAVEVGSPEMLRMLFVLTGADLAAVGPGVLNDWKTEVLSDLYSRAMQYLSGDRRSLDTEERLRQTRAEVRKCLPEVVPSWFEEQIAGLSPAYLHSTPPQQIAAELQKLHGLPSGEVLATGRYLAETNTVEYTVATRENVTPGLFHKLAGALAAKGLQVLSAEINTLKDGLVLDRFYVNDQDFAQEPPPDRIVGVCKSLESSLKNGAPPPLHQARRYGRSVVPTELNPIPPRVSFDNSQSDGFTVIDVFAHDCIGLLYIIGRSLFELGLNISVAKIGTFLDQVVDVFYVTDAAHRKIEDEQRQEEIRSRLLADIQAFVASQDPAQRTTV